MNPREVKTKKAIYRIVGSVPLMPGNIPLMGDWNVDGNDDIGIFRPSNGIWSLDSNGNLAGEGSDTSLSWACQTTKPHQGTINLFFIPVFR